MERGGVVYFMTNKTNAILYVGVTSNLRERVFQHKKKFYPNSFTAKYNCTKIVFYLFFPSIEEAINEEKRIKAGSRQQKINLIEKMNLLWEDLYETLDD
ncbi:GIY-YIG nuclease family protein [Sphingobacterium composti Ten et al. 2007 non Yoo et al. 2007]|uniref:GIY-YIG nuclease family protein n=1 Tax=Sphingobacterium composti TaxID=363260 RepID=UPI00135A9A18|nr:GIY-YIG nuclease family protein [Sphingobacterium composti Ten et al. 2007 non Yoo et al. 2007]